MWSVGGLQWHGIRSCRLVLRYDQTIRNLSSGDIDCFG